MTPYLSIVFANRNDHYTPDQACRIRKFIEFYSYCNKKYNNLFEFVICDWNPPTENPPLRDAYDWGKLGNVIHLIVPKEIHEKLCPDHSRPILDYTARNACIRRATAPFILVINQDIFLSSSILEFLAKRSLSKNYFYRADRCDFVLNYEESFSDWEHFDDYAKGKALCKHIRPTSHVHPMSLSLQNNEFDSIYTKKWKTEYKLNNIIYSDYYYYRRKFISCLYKFPKMPTLPPKYFNDYHLHTNASGDFLIAPKHAFFATHGFVETHEFYMHLDSYMCVQLFAAGYKQAILAHPHTVFHSDHSRRAREHRSESMSYAEHVKIWSQMCIGKHPFKINSPSWGLSEMNL